MREALVQKLEKRVLVCDGAMGTMLYSKGVAFSRCFDELTLTMPQLVKEVHLAYVKAGADVIQTNTFGANRPRLQKFELEDRAREINLAAARLAREVAGEDLYVAGSVGPLGIHLEPLGPTSLDEARDMFREQIAALVTMSSGRRAPRLQVGGLGQRVGPGKAIGKDLVENGVFNPVRCD